MALNNFKSEFHGTYKAVNRNNSQTFPKHKRQIHAINP
jgi:hypothetical protein